MPVTKLTRLSAEYIVTVHGTAIYGCWANEHNALVGLAWGARAKGDDGKMLFMSTGSYVESSARRQGVRTELNRAIFKDHDLITTVNGTQSGLAFMKASGYKHDKRFDQWVLTGRVFKQKQFQITTVKES